MTAAGDRFWMEQALALAALGEGTTWPNPVVGCVVVRDGRVVGSGFHRASGEPHAETLAIESAGERARGATLYLNLEPCAHEGHTPPCTDAIIQGGIARVVASITDPDPRVNGKGFRRLTEAGIEVETGLLAAQAAAINRVFLHWHTTARPWVTVKAASSIDGALAAGDGRSKWITGAVARRVGHRLRLCHDAVLVGAETVRRDDPRLSVRLAGPEIFRRRVVLSGTLDLEPGAQVFEPGEGRPQTLVYTSEAAKPECGERLRGVAEIRRVSGTDARVDLSAVVDDLGRSGVQSILVEGGGRTLAGFVESGLADEAALFEAPILMGSTGATPMLDTAVVADPARSWRLEDVRRVPVGEDTLLLGRFGRREDG